MVCCHVINLLLCSVLEFCVYAYFQGPYLVKLQADFISLNNESISLKHVFKSLGDNGLEIKPEGPGLGVCWLGTKGTGRWIID